MLGRGSLHSKAPAHFTTADLAARITRIEELLELPAPDPHSAPPATTAEVQALTRTIDRQAYRLLHLTRAYDALLARALAAEAALATATRPQ